MGERHKEAVNKEIQDLAKEENKRRASLDPPQPPLHRPHLQLYHDALTNCVKVAMADPEKDCEIHQLVDLWNKGPPAHIQAK